MTTFEAIAHIEMLCTTVALNLQGSPKSKEEASKNRLIAAKLGGLEIQVSSAPASLPYRSTASTSPSNCSDVYVSGNVGTPPAKKNEPGTPTKIGLPGSVHPLADQVIRRFPVTNR